MLRRESCIFLEGESPVQVSTVTPGSRLQIGEDILISERSKTRRFHVLYDRIWRNDVLQEAWKRVRENRMHGLKGGFRKPAPAMATGA